MKEQIKVHPKRYIHITTIIKFHDIMRVLKLQIALTLSKILDQFLDLSKMSN